MFKSPSFNKTQDFFQQKPTPFVQNFPPPGLSRFHLHGFPYRVGGTEVSETL